VHLEQAQLRVGVAQWVVHVTCNRSVMSLSHIKGSHCFLKQETLPHTWLAPGNDSSVI